MPQSNSTLDVIRESLMGEMRHRVVRRLRDGAYWYVSEYRGPHGWLPMKVNNQPGHESAALKLFYESTR